MFVCAGAVRAPSDCVGMGIKAALPKYEIYFYNTVLCLAMFWSASWVFEVSSCEYERTHTHMQTHMQTHTYSLNKSVDILYFLLSNKFCWF